jgi:hypothetical protein
MRHQAILSSDLVPDEHRNHKGGAKMRLHRKISESGNWVEKWSSDNGTSISCEANVCKMNGKATSHLLIKAHILSQYSQTAS